MVDIRLILSTTNRWWVNPRNWTEDDPDLREVAKAPFQYSSEALSGLTPGGLYVLRGPRRVGKSVLIKQAIRRLLAEGVAPRLIVHMSVEGWRAEELWHLARAVDQMTVAGHRFWFLDEITGVTGGWPQRIKWLRDNDPRFRTDTVVLTGSSSADFRQTMGVLAGRRGPVGGSDRVLLPMGFRTFAGVVAEQDVPSHIGPIEMVELASDLSDVVFDLLPWMHKLVDSWETYLRVGGFPQAVADQLLRHQPRYTLGSGLMEVLSGDAFRRARLSDLQTAALLRRLVKGLGSPLNVARVAREINVSLPTAQRRISDLREAFIVWPCYREQGLTPRLRAQEKVYFTDPIYTRLTGGRPDLSTLSEQQLGTVLLRALERKEPGAYLRLGRVLHHRSQAGREIDFVGPDFGSLAIESKYVDGGPWKRVAQALKSSPWQGLVATRSLLDLEDPLVLAIPTAMLAWLLDT